MAGVANRRSVFEQSPLRNRWPRAVLPFLAWGGWGWLCCLFP